MIGEALVPYYRQILPVFNMFKNKRSTYHFKQWTLVIRSTIRRERTKTLLSWFKRLYKFWRSMVEKMLISTSNIWFQLTRVACSDHVPAIYIYCYIDNLCRYIQDLQQELKKSATISVLTRLSIYCRRESLSFTKTKKQMRRSLYLWCLNFIISSKIWSKISI
jgi:hypothetical protein